MNIPGGIAERISMQFEDMVKIKNISKEYHLPCIDNYYDIPINKFNRTHWFPSGDGTHHNEKGGKLIAEHMSNVIF